MQKPVQLRRASTLDNPLSPRAAFSRIRRGLTQSALAASHAKDTYLRSFYWRISSKRGPKKARIATAHKQLKIAFLIVRDGVRYKDLGPDHFDRRNLDRTKKYLVGRLESLGLNVTVDPAA